MRIYDVEKVRKEDPLARLEAAIDKSKMVSNRREPLHMGARTQDTPIPEQPAAEKPEEDKSLFFRALNDYSPSKFTEEMEKELIVKIDFLVFPETTTTVCCMHLKNGFHIFGIGSCVRPANFDEAIGRDMAVADARSKLWEYLVFLEAEKGRSEQSG